MADTDNYILDGHKVVPATIEQWLDWFGTANRHFVDVTILDDGTRVSTVFLGIDHNFGGDGPPLLFETMVFPPEPDYGGDLYMERCSTWEEAEDMHKRAVEKFSNASS